MPYKRTIYFIGGLAGMGKSSRIRPKMIEVRPGKLILMETDFIRPFTSAVLTNDSIADIPLTITAGQAVYINDPDIMINSDSIGVQESTGGPIDTSLSVTIPSGDQLALYFYVGVPGSPGAVPLIDQTGLTIPGNYFAYITASVGYCARLINIFITLN